MNRWCWTARQFLSLTATLWLPSVLRLIPVLRSRERVPSQHLFDPEDLVVEGPGRGRGEEGSCFNIFTREASYELLTSDAAERVGSEPRTRVGEWAGPHTRVGEVGRTASV